MSAAGKPPRGLGRGLDALLPAAPPRPATPQASYGSGNVFSVPLDKLVPQKGQPRQHVDGQRLDELAESLRQHGLIEPLVVRRLSGKDELEIIAGERRWRAAQRAGLREVLVVVREVSARDAYELALIENVQREDLNPIELADALQRLIDEHGYTQEALAARIGKDRSTVANALRLSKLPAAVRRQVVEGTLTEGHARALLGAPDAALLEQLAQKVVKGKLSVRDTERLVRQAKTRAGGDGAPAARTPAVRDLEQRLIRKYGTRCEVRDRKGKGEIVVRYASLDELDRIIDLLL
jgi:ParB family chromosome partitioning protein